MTTPTRCIRRSRGVRTWYGGANRKPSNRSTAAAVGPQSQHGSPMSATRRGERREMIYLEAALDSASKLGCELTVEDRRSAVLRGHAGGFNRRARPRSNVRRSVRGIRGGGRSAHSHRTARGRVVTRKSPATRAGLFSIDAGSGRRGRGRRGRHAGGRGRRRVCLAAALEGALDLVHVLEIVEVATGLLEAHEGAGKGDSR